MKKLLCFLCLIASPALAQNIEHVYLFKVTNEKGRFLAIEEVNGKAVLAGDLPVKEAEKLVKNSIMTNSSPNKQ